VSSPTPPNAASAAFVVVLIMALSLAFTGSYAGALHQPTFHNVPIAVTPGIPGSLTSRLRASAGIDPKPVGTPAQARASIDRRETYAALVAVGSVVDLVVTPAASPVIAARLSSRLAGSLRAAGTRVRVSVVHRLAPGDPSGAVGFYAVTGWVIAGYLGAVLLGAVFGPLPQRRQMAARMGTLTVIALLAGFSGAWLTFAIGDLPGSLVGAGLLGTLTILAVGAAATALQALLGPGATIVTILVFVVVGYPASGGPIATQLLPGFWRSIGHLIPVGASTTALRDIVYFPDASLNGPLLTILIWLAAGASAALLLAGRHHDPPTMTQAEAAGAAASAP
jgi:hypothetical protein